MRAKSIVIGKIESRMKAAKSMGAGEVLLASDRLESTAKEVFSLTKGVGASLVIIASKQSSGFGFGHKDNQEERTDQRICRYAKKHHLIFG